MNKVFNENCLDTIARFIDGFLNTVVTSPPYFNLRDYGLEPTPWPEITFKLNEFTPEITVPPMTVCLGLETNPVHYIAHMVHIFRMIKPKLKDDGTIWINIGDSYASTSKNRTPEQALAKSTTASILHQSKILKQNSKIVGGLKPKDLIGIPWMFAFALRADGWYLRQDIIWAKKQAMPESVRDRCTRAHEFIFMLSKHKKYYYDADAIKTPAKNPADDVRRLNAIKENHKIHPGKLNNGLRSDKQRGHSRRHAGFNERWDNMTKEQQQANGANRRSVWLLSTSGSKEKHYAQYNLVLPELMIKAGCPIGGIVYDPFSGSGTTLLTAANLGFGYVGSEMSSEYYSIINRRLNDFWLKYMGDVI